MFKTFATVAVVLAASPAFADVRASYMQDGRTLFSFDVPDFWTLTSGGERLLTPPDEDIARPVPQVVAIRPSVEPDVWMGFFSPRGVATLSEGQAYLTEIGQFLTTTPEISSNAPGRVAGLPAQLIKGTGERDGRDLVFTIAVVDLPGGRIAIAAAVVEIGADPALVGQVNEIFASMRAGQ
ncbi:MAG: hypothetical protein QNI90_09665 [Dinoroseobacter sp.]|nr:hypothetical protein [Dinoroseobacter sp.]